MAHPHPKINGPRQQIDDIDESLPPFVASLWSMVNSADACSWTSDGLSFKIDDADQFESQTLPTFFKHSQLSSFVRQLNMYNFHKTEGQLQWTHPKFCRHHAHWLPLIKRKPSSALLKAAAASAASTAPSKATSTSSSQSFSSSHRRAATSSSSSVSSAASSTSSSAVSSIAAVTALQARIDALLSQQSAHQQHIAHLESSGKQVRARLLRERAARESLQDEMRSLIQKLPAAEYCKLKDSFGQDCLPSKKAKDTSKPAKDDFTSDIDGSDSVMTPLEQSSGLTPREEDDHNISLPYLWAPPQFSAPLVFNTSVPVATPTISLNTTGQLQSNVVLTVSPRADELVFDFEDAAWSPLAPLPPSISLSSPLSEHSSTAASSTSFLPRSNTFSGWTFGEPLENVSTFDGADSSSSAPSPVSDSPATRRRRLNPVASSVSSEVSFAAPPVVIDANTLMSQIAPVNAPAASTDAVSASLSTLPVEWQSLLTTFGRKEDSSRGTGAPVDDLQFATRDGNSTLATSQNAWLQMQLSNFMMQTAQQMVANVAASTSSILPSQ